jgi:putative membrane protein
MTLEIFIAILVGCLFGIVTGLIPGIHINLVSLIVLSFSVLLLEITSPLIISVFIISMAITHTFLDTIPSIFLGAPEAETALSVLPGHKMLLEGKGYEAVMLTLIGSFFALIITIVLAFPIGALIEQIYPYLQKFMAYILIAASVFLIHREKKGKMFLWPLIIFLLAGVLGIATLNLPNLENPLFPLLSGLFGTSTLIISLSDKTKIPLQKISFPKIKKLELTKTMGSSIVAGSLCSFLPGLGPAQAAILGSEFYKKITNEGFLILIGGLNTINMVLSLIALFLLDKARNGAIVAVSKIMDVVTFQDTLIFLASALIAGGIAVFLTINITKVFSKLFSKINYRKLVVSIILLIILMVFFLSSNFLGLLILTVSTFTGILPAKLGIGRNHLMGCLLLPVILYFLL